VPTTNEPDALWSKPIRRRFQYRLRTLFLLTTIVALALSLLRWIYVTWGLEIVGIVAAVGIEATFYLGFTIWFLRDADRRIKPGAWRVVLVAIFAFFGPIAIIPWLLLRPRTLSVLHGHDTQVGAQQDRLE
jgi:hypothetical protein